MTVTIISHPDCSQHFMGSEHPESPTRIAAIQDHLLSSGVDFTLNHVKATPIKKALLALAHEPNYIDFIFASAPINGYFELDADTQMNPHSLNAALLAAGAAVEAVDLVATGKASSVFCATRPPGHHAERDKAMGFCLFNNIAIAAIYAKQQYQFSRIAVLDFDVHHGNGTENILIDKQGFLFCSTFQYPLYPNSGVGEHPAHIINTPLPAYSSGTEFRQAIEQHWLPALHQFQPEMIFISAGFDAHKEDNISQVQLNENDYLWVTQQIKSIADQYAGGKIISVLEGGYSLDALGRSVVAHIRALIG